MLGKLDLNAIPLSEPIPLITSLVVILGILAILGWITVRGFWPYLWREWITSVDHKRIGVMYCLLGLVMLLRGFSDALLMRSHQAFAAGEATGYLPPDHYNQIFSAHGTIMIFFVAMPLVVGLMNFVVPLQIGARDVAFPTLNSISFWLTASGALLINVSLFIGVFARTGWLVYPPLSELQYSPDVGVDYYLWSVQISGVGTLLSAINLVTTILKLRAPGMALNRMPVFCWTALAANLVILAAFPVLTATLAMLTLDRYLDFHFFTNDGGGNAMMFVNLIWIWGHPEVYILVLPAFGVYSEIAATFSGKPLFGYRTMVIATMAICVLSCLVWLHHFFTMGASANVNAFFGIMTMVIAVPTGAKIFNWLFTMYGGRVRFEVPVLWLIGFMVTFVIGGMTGVLMAVPPVDFVLHNSLFLVAHFHNVIIGGVVFGAFAAYTYWFPKAFGFKLHDGLGRAAFWFWLSGFYVAFMPLYALGLMGATRRIQHYDDLSWQPYMWVALLGAILILCGLFCQIAQLVVSIRNRASLRDDLGDPWDGRTLEWATSSPPPSFNFAVIPRIAGKEAYWWDKQRAIIDQRMPDEPSYATLVLPRRAPTGFITAFFASFTGFALIWHIWWLAFLGLLGIYAGFLGFAWRRADEELVPAVEVARLDRARRKVRSEALLGLDAQRVGEALPPVPLSSAEVENPQHENEPEKRIISSFGFWIFLLSDIVMFSALFAAYAVLRDSTDGGPTSNDLFDWHNVALQTVLLLVSSYACGLAMLAAKGRNMAHTQIFLGLTGLLGAFFLALELREFAGLLEQGTGPSRSAFLSAFFALVGCHGLHVAGGLIWLATTMVQLAGRGFQPNILRRLTCFSLFWHALDIVWVAVFTIVYLYGTLP
jgi:cytochrome o ubiquinol oxidase subunit 1